MKSKFHLRGVTWTAMALVFSTLQISSVHGENLLKIPKGYQEGRKDAVYGTYSTVMSNEAQHFQSRTLNLENRAYGLSKLSKEGPVEISEVIYLMELATLRLHLDIVNAPKSVLSDFEREALLLTTVRVYQQIRFQAERLFEDMVRFIDVKLPGPNGLQMRTNEILSTGEVTEAELSLYWPNYRQDKTLDQLQRDELYKIRVSEFQKKGGSLSEIQLMTQDYLKGLGPYTRLEYVVRENNEVWVTEGVAGHVLLAAGGAVKSAGQLILLKNSDGQFSLMVISNSSGNFKPDLINTALGGSMIRKIVGLDTERVVLTKGEPVSTQAVKVYLKGLGVDKSLIEPRLKRLDNMLKDMILRRYPGLSTTQPGLKSQSAFSCKALFN